MDCSIMAKRGNSVIGIDLGKHAFKGVVLQRKGDERFVLTSYASREVPEEMDTAEELGQQLKLLLKELGGSAKGCAIAVSDPAALLRIIEQPDTPIDLLRSALRFNGLNVLNQECKDFVLDCAPVTSNGQRQRHAHARRQANGSAQRLGAMLRRHQQRSHARKNISSAACSARSVKQISEADGQSARRRRHPATGADLFL